jgi:predicted Rossmann-fold nucleotide-binding protein
MTVSDEMCPSVRVMPARWERHGRAAGPIRNRELLQLAIAEAMAHTSAMASTSVLVVAFPGGAGTASLVQQARSMAARSPVPISVAQVSPSAGLWAVPASARS